MYKQLAVDSLLLGAIIAGGSAAYYFTQIDPLERERQEILNMLAKCDELIVVANMAVQLTIDYPSQMSPERDQQALDNQKQIMTAKDAWVLKYQDVNQRIRSTKRTSIIGVAIGLFFCLIQAPFLLVASNQG